MTLKIGISGIRGIVGDSLTDGVASDFIKAFADHLKKGPVIVGRDTRASGGRLEGLAIDALTGCGIDVIDAGISPTPTVQLLVKKNKAAGGIIITASHNPPQWNGFKFTNEKGIFLNAEENGRLLDIYASKKFKLHGRKAKITILDDPYKDHIEAVLKAVDVGLIKACKFTVALDSCNGAGSVITPMLLERLGCGVIPVFTDIKKGFPREAEPLPQNLGALRDKVKGKGADIGFAQDPDADRLSIVAEDGTAIGEEYSFVLAALEVLSSGRPARNISVVTNLSTSMMIDAVAKQYGAKVIRTKVGEINVVEGLIKAKGVIGGEGNGGVIYPEVVTSRDSLTGIALILMLMAKRKKKISEIAGSIPKYHMIKSKINCNSASEVTELLERTKKLYRGEKIDLLDGVRVETGDGWLHVRPSNTEPVIRIIAEAKSREKAEQLVSSVSGS